MNVLDELRDALLDVSDQWILGGLIDTGDIRDCLDAFKAEHPLLHECEDPINCHECKGKFPACSWTEDWGERELMLRNSDGEIDDHEFVPVCPACAAVTP